jgi:hypothetical protein
VDIAAAVTLTAGATETNEATGPTLNVVVARPADPAPVPLRVYVTIGGTATAPIFGNPVTWDYNAAGITLPGFNVFRAFVDIPAGVESTTFSVTPINDARIEGDETIVFTVSTDQTYDAASPSSTALVIRDDDVVGGPTVAESNFLYETAPQRVRFRFSQNVAASIGADDFEVSGPGGTAPFGFAYDATLNTSTLTFGAILADGNYTARAIAAGITNSGGQPMPSDHILDFHVLAGDANRDRRVNLSDFNILAANFGQSNRTFSQGDFNYDGRVNLADFNILASRFGAALGPGVSAREADRGINGRDEARELIDELQ